MTRARDFALPAYLGLCIILGGSSQGIWGNAFLQFGAVAILVWAMLTGHPQAIPAKGRQLLYLAGILGLLFLLQLVPLPPALWTALPNRDFLVRGFELLAMPLPWLPASLAPYDTLETAVTLLPPLALLVGMLRLKAWSMRGMLAAIVIGALSAILLGILQVSAGDGSWYFYRRTNLGLPVGTFANANHFATLVLAALPVLAAIALTDWRLAAGPQARAFTLALASGAAAVLAIGLIIGKSAAILLIGPPVAAATILMALRLPPRRLLQGLAIVVGIVALAAAALILFGDNLPGWGTSVSIETRAEYWAQSLRIAMDHAITGTGFGSFEQMYPRHEDPATVTQWYVNHAHNDFVEVAMEGGVPALVLVGLFIWWWAGRALHSWLSSAGSLEQKAAAVASAAILLHSAFDYPLRTAAMAAIMATCLALLAGARGRPAQQAAREAEPVRHATL